MTVVVVVLLVGLFVASAAAIYAGHGYVNATKDAER